MFSYSRGGKSGHDNQKHAFLNMVGFKKLTKRHLVVLLLINHRTPEQFSRYINARKSLIVCGLRCGCTAVRDVSVSCLRS